MRKYTRKKPESALIEDAIELCRLCLQKPQEGIPIFDGTSNICGTLSLRIMMCVGLELTHEDCLSNIICTSCYDELNRCYTFRKKCEVSYQKLKSHLQALKEKAFLHKTLEEVVQNEVIEKKDSGFLYDEAQLDVKVCNGVIEVTSNVDTNEQSKIENEEKYEESAHLIQETTNEISPDMSSFLSTLLVQVGVLSQDNDTCCLMDPWISDLQLTMGNGRTVTFELLEEDEDDNELIENEKLDVEELDLVPEEKRNSSSLQISRVIKTNSQELKNDNQEQGVCCGACGKRLSSRGALRRHARVHSGERPHACTMCSRRFGQRSVLERHKLVHLERRPFQCSVCSKSFTQRSALAAHGRTHEAPHSRALQLHRCPHCNKLFLYPSSLSRHMMMHSGRVYECGGCHKQFRDRSSLQRHLKTHNHKTNETL